MYNEIIVRHFSNPEFAQELDQSQASIEIGNPVCGDKLRINLSFEGDLVKMARYQAWGCATALATGNIFYDYIQGLSRQQSHRHGARGSS